MGIVTILYLVDFTENISSVCTVLIVFYILAWLLTSCLWAMSQDGYAEEFNKNITILIGKLYKKLWIFLLAMFFCITLPSQKTIYLMLGASYMQSSNLPKKVSEALELKLDDVISELKDKKK